MQRVLLRLIATVVSLLVDGVSVRNSVVVKRLRNARTPTNLTLFKKQILANSTGETDELDLDADAVAIQQLREKLKGLKGFKMGLNQSLIHLDNQPLVLNMSFVDGLNPKDGNPWVRYKKVSEAGTTKHPHFNGLTATGDFDHDVLVGHNVVRERVGLPGMQSDDDLKSMAVHRLQELVSGGCYIQHSDTSYRWGAAGFQYVGENVYKVINMVPTGVDLADAWYAEIYDYTYGIVGEPCVRDKCAHRSSPPCAIGHFTQMMWKASTHLGCAKAECPNEAKRTSIGVCYYGEGGNIVGRIPFGQGAASKLEYEGLCN